jgi:serine phosphatase RsbU (regulator of sigma subunit)/anti-sigma regulatory factor (Ser/Thr protein kinase)
MKHGAAGEERDMDGAEPDAGTGASGRLDPPGTATGPAAPIAPVAAGAAVDYLSLDDMLAQLLGRVQSDLNVDTAAVLLLDEDRGVLVARAARGLEEEVRQGVEVPLGRGFAGRVAALCRPIVLEHVSKPAIVNPILEQVGLSRLLGVPLQVEGRVIGVLHVGTLAPRTFGEDDVRLLELAAERAALTIEEALLSEQRAVTRTMQRTLLPQALPEVPGLRFSAKYLPGGAGVKIGGDWYDVFLLADGRIAFVIGDVVGRGALAASVMGEIRTAVRAYLLEGHDLPTVVTLLNELLLTFGGHRSATVAIFTLDLETEQLLAISAGHVPALLLDAEGGTRFVAQASGPPLGIDASGKLAVSQLSFPAGSSLLLYTDGLVERRGEPIDAGMQRLMDAAETARSRVESTLADCIYEALARDSTLEDDVALLAIESLALGSRIEMSLDAAPRSLGPMRRTLGRWLAAHGVGGDERFAITMAVSEAAGNAIEHAYGPREARFTVTCERLPGEVCIVVSDTGGWRGTTRSGRGRGLLIMRELMDGIDVDSGELGTTVTLTKHVAEPRP